MRINIQIQYLLVCKTILKFHVKMIKTFNLKWIKWLKLRIKILYRISTQIYRSSTLPWFRNSSKINHLYKTMKFTRITCSYMTGKRRTGWLANSASRPSYKHFRKVKIYIKSKLIKLIAWNQTLRLTINLRTAQVFQTWRTMRKRELTSTWASWLNSTKYSKKAKTNLITFCNSMSVTLKIHQNKFNRVSKIKRAMTQISTRSQVLWTNKIVIWIQPLNPYKCLSHRLIRRSKRTPSFKTKWTPILWCILKKRTSKIWWKLFFKSLIT